MSATEPIAWKLVEPSELHWRHWDDQFVVYNAASGDTHVLQQPAGEILRLIERSPAESSRLTAELASLLDLPADEDLSLQVERLLQELSELNLIEAVRS
jgi:PqqD family protein of HPr-rel-A system